MKTVLTTFLCLVLFVAAFQVAWSVKATPTPKPVERPATVPPPDKPVQFDDAYQRYVDKIVHSKYADRLPLEEERIARHLSIIKEQLQVQQRLIEEARRP